MASLLVLAGCLGAGWLLRGRLDPAPLQVYVLYVGLPALALVEVHRAPGLSAWGVASVWLVFAAAVALFAAAGRAFGWDRATVGCLALTCGLSNTSFVGFPLLEAWIGPDAVAAAVPLDQLGSFLIVATVAPLVAARAAGRGASAADLARLLRFPALPAVLLALLLRDVPFPAALETGLARVGATLSPVALIAVGAQLRAPPRADWRPLGAGLAYKLALAPLLVLAWMRLGGEGGLGARVAVLEAAMAPMVTGAMLATAYGLRPELAAALLSVGVPVSLVTVAAWAWATG